MNIYEKIDLNKVINASGKMTALGVSTIKDSVGDYMKEAAMSFVKIEDLIEKAGELISKYTGGEDSCITLGASAGIAISVASCISGNDISKIEKLPISEGLKNEVIIQKGHAINFGAPVTQMIRLGGGLPIEVGQSNKVNPYHIEEAINEKTAALIYIKSHHAVQKGMTSIENMVNISRKYDIPLIIDAAAEEDLKKYILLGGDLVIYSGGKAIEGPTSGFITGRKDLVKCCRLQYKGIGRAMKIGKENIMGLLKAIELYDKNDNSKEVVGQREAMEWLSDEVNQIQGLVASIVKDEAGREIYRCQIKVEKDILGVDANYIIENLEEGDPSIYTRNHYANIGIINVDPRPLKRGEERVILERIKEIVKDIK
ncbi:DgaE family pyridoxal phosphate-dependent ammonia lyase [Sporosalibacterium faouarense]|uniref:DgaE family pyridoxal phosphate-dependent ammonia lyase n=1 Tax=Sporosalibacterium faouarense TaxID=516123 RepID=UPI00141C85F5|nr:DgaE family pyridoxal phosphate-dependent ammonia lyase [Sporosalibacterium faouarense]MTI46280.1 DgaE family pyridoxal phosphate-dependent ammonia lyase [Bacillota bacterium]